MSLDQNLFTLLLTPNTALSSADSPAGFGASTVIDLVDPFGTVHYRKRQVVSQGPYRMEVSDPLSEALLASATAPSATSKHKTLELYNPSQVVELKYTGTFSFRWSFKWGEHEFEWKREECFIIRKPDPPVLVAVTKEPPGRIKTSVVQILDYNLNRFDIEDRKGLDIVILTSLLTFGDASDAYHEPNATASSPTSTSPPPLKAPKLTPKKGVERIAELQQGKGEVNEVSVFDEGAMKDYAKHCSQLLQDDVMLFISVRSSDPAQVQKVLQVVEETKKLRHKTGAPDLHQYSFGQTEDTAHYGPRVFNLDDTGKGKGKTKVKDYASLSSITIHLSKIDMPELRPRDTSASHSSPTRPNEKRESKKDKKNKARIAPPLPPRPSTVLHKPRSQYFPNHPPQHAHELNYEYPYPTLYTPPPPLPPRGSASGIPRRQSMYGSLHEGMHHYTYQEDVPGPSSPQPQPGIFSRLLGR